MDVAPGMLVVWSDVGCPWAHLAVFRLHRARARAGLEDRVHFDHRAFPLEIVNEQPTPRRVLEAEIPVIGGHDPDAGWQVWQGDDGSWPVTMLPALEAVQAAKDQGIAASEALDLALRRAFYAESRCISLRHVILDVARGCDGVDADQIAAALDDGRARAAVMEQFHEARSADEVTGSPHVFLPDGGEVHNPGIQQRWEGPHGEGFPVIEADDPDVFDHLVKRAAD
jgi:predicted DsbA family dithiol-disulfide isomerase